MRLRNTHTLITAYAALVTLAAGLVVFAPKPLEKKTDSYVPLVIKSVTQPATKTLAARSRSGDRPGMAVE